MCFAFALVTGFVITYSVYSVCLTSAHVASDFAIYSSSHVRGSGHETSSNLIMISMLINGDVCIISECKVLIT